MGVNSRRPLLPAPTESIVDTTGSTITNTDMATDVSRRTDKSSYSLPDDGSPITISTRRRSNKKDEDDSSKLSRTSHQSQTSLLIEYFEREKSSSRLHSRPSVRVKVIPSGRKSRDHSDTIRIRESGSSKRPQYTRRISVSTPSKQKAITEGNDDQSITDEEHDSRPLEIEFLDRENTSDLSNDRYIQPTSEISSMPADSMLDGSMVSKVPQRKRSQSLDKARGTSEADLLKAPSRRRSRSLSRERIAYRVAQKLNAGDLLATETKPLKKRSHKHQEEDQPSVESSLLSGSNVSSRHKSGDAISFRSNTSKSSLNNTKFLETVEDAIRRLILPELKELKNDQKVSVNKTKFDRDTIDSAGASSKDVPKRRLSKHSSAPDVSRSSLSVTNADKEEVVTPEERRRRHKERRREKESGPASPEDSLRIRKGSLPTNQRAFTEEEVLRRQRSKGLRDAAAAGIVGSALTAAALKHHDSKSSLGKKPRKRKSKGSSRTASINDSDTELVFQKHNVPPMPFRSDIETELTRDSILSQRTVDTENTETPTPRQVQEVIRGSPRGALSPTPRTPTRTPLGDQRETNSRQSHRSDHETYDEAGYSYGDVLLEGTGDAIAAAAVGNLLGHNSDHDMRGPGDHLHRSRTLSPIQSVASDDDLRETQLEDESREQETNDRRYSIESLSSAPSTELARSFRPEAISLESRSEILKQHASNTELGYETNRDIEGEPHEADWNEAYPVHDLDENGKIAPRDDDIDYADDDDNHTEYEDSLRQVTKGAAVNPQFVSGVGVESAVGTLVDASVLDTRSGLSQPRSQADSMSRSVDGSIVEEVHEHSLPASSRRGSPLKHEYDLHHHDEKSFTKRLGAASPPQSVTQSEEDSGEHDERYPLDAPIMEDGHRDITPDEDEYPEEDDSEMITNPSIIQGPIGSVPHDSRDHWPYDANPSQARDIEFSSQHDANAPVAIGGLDLAAELPKTGYDQTYGQGYVGPILSTPHKDEGYISGANPMSPSNASPEPRKPFSTLDHEKPPALFVDGDLDVDDDPFTGAGHQRHFSGYSHGMASPIYDSATGRGIDSIESKDIIALMNHLTVRDAQRNARDTEILVTLVRSAAEMRSSFLEMKKYIADQDEMLLQANEKQHERTRAIGGPRPLPASRSNRQLAAAEFGEEAQAKRRRNVFRRALKSLSTKSSNDLTKIEDMLEQLLDEVEALRAAQEGRSVGLAANAASFNSNGNGGAYTDGYEPEGQAGTGSPGEQSGYTSNSSRPLADARPLTMRRASENRISTVPEGDEEIDTYEQPLLERDVPYDERVVDERSVPEQLGTPPRKPVPTGSGSQETTPRKSEDKSRKHKSSNSSFFKISRWSKTTASTVGDGIRNSIQPSRKERPSSEMSRSGSDLANRDHYNTGGFYDPHGDDRLRSSFTVDDEQQDNRPPSPLVPSQVSEGPKYKAHRDSFNLQHPQPQKGPTDRYQNHLEYQAQDYAPTSPTSERWGSQSSLPHYAANTNRYSNGNARLTPISDAGYSEVSSRGPPRPPKVKDAGPLVPQRPPKIKEDETSEYADQFATRSNRGSSSPRNQPPIRKPTGPRPITSSGQYSPSNIKRQQYRGSPNRIDYDDDDY